MNVRFWIVRLKKLVLYVCLGLFLLLLILLSHPVMASVKKALFLCYETVIPALFPFFVLSSLLSSGSVVSLFARFLSPLMRPLFGVSGSGAIPFVVGIISGYPTGAKMTCDLYNRNAICKKDAARLLAYTNNTGPIFMIGALGSHMLGSTKAGIFLYLVHILAAFLVGLFLKNHKGNQKTFTQKFSPVYKTISFSEAVESATTTMLTVCGYIIFFAALTTCITNVLQPFLSITTLSFVQAFLEVTAGAKTLVSLPFGGRTLLCLLSFFVGTGGLCVALQVRGILLQTDLPIKMYFWGKLLQGLLAMGLTFLIYPLVF